MSDAISDKQNFGISKRPPKVGWDSRSSCRSAGQADFCVYPLAEFVEAVEQNTGSKLKTVSTT